MAEDSVRSTFRDVPPDALSRSDEAGAAASFARVLVVEDEAIAALDIADALESAGHVVVGVAAEFEQALYLTLERRPDLAIVDIKLANEIDGLTVAEEMCRHHGMQIVFATAFPELPLCQGRTLSRDCVLIKPYSRSDLLGAVQEAIKRSRSSLQASSRATRAAFGCSQTLAQTE